MPVVELHAYRVIANELQVENRNVLDAGDALSGW